MTSPGHSELPDFVTLKERFNQEMTPGQRAELRRAAHLEELTMKPALYRLLQGRRPTEPYLRIAFLLPWAEHRPTATHFSAQCFKAKVNEVRLFQIARSHDPADMIQLRRVAMQIKPFIDWNQFGRMLWYWHRPHTKREFIENYYLSQNHGKEFNKESPNEPE